VLVADGPGKKEREIEKRERERDTYLSVLRL
jgi:hypothetical protein